MKAQIQLDEISTAVLKATAMLTRTPVPEVLAAVVTVAISDLEELSERATNDLVTEGERLSEDGFSITVSDVTADEKTPSGAPERA